MKTYWFFANEGLCNTATVRCMTLNKASDYNELTD